MGQRHVDLGSVEITVLDEADHMADLGFLPGVRRIMDTTPRRGQRMLFSATLDAGVDVLVKRFLSDPATHQADSAQSPVSTMTHHVLHVSHDGRLPVLLDLTAAPGRSVVFTRTKHGAKKLAKQLNASGVSAVELHGNLSQSARTRNMNMFHSGAASTLVATDIAARGIHVDAVGIVIHAAPPVGHKAYLPRSATLATSPASPQSAPRPRGSLRRTPSWPSSHRDRASPPARSPTGWPSRRRARRPAVPGSSDPLPVRQLAGPPLGSRTRRGVVVVTAPLRPAASPAGHGATTGRVAQGPPRRIPRPRPATAPAVPRRSRRARESAPASADGSFVPGRVIAHLASRDHAKRPGSCARSVCSPSSPRR